MSNLTKVIIIGLVVVTLGTAAWGVNQKQAADQAQRVLGGMYERAALDLSEGLFEMEVTISKALAATSSERITLYLERVHEMATEAQRNLSQLPISSEEALVAMKLFNQLSDYANALGRRLVEGETLTQDETTQLRDLATRLGQIDFDIAQMEFGQLYLADSGNWESLTLPDEEYPALLYDGPFSDAKRGEVKGITGDEITLEDALNLARRYFDPAQIKDVYETQERLGEIPAWGVGVQLDDMRAYLQITKQGGHLLMMVADEIMGDMDLTEDEMRAIAEDFLIAQGFTHMAWTFEQLTGDVMVFNFVATQDGVLLYPDLIKVQVSRRNGQVVGVESDEYLRNHVQRTLETPALNEEAARGRVGLLQVEDVKLCVIPMLNDEIYCYQFLCSQGESRYLIYINAMTGDEENILLIVESGGSRVVI